MNNIWSTVKILLTIHTICAQQIIQIQQAYPVIPDYPEFNDTFGTIFNKKITKTNSKSFTFYWNVPTFMCAQHNVTFKDLHETYGIVQNKNDAWRGDEIVILYDPGKFPALLELDSKLYSRNGGVPQEGDLQEHIDAFGVYVNEVIPDVKFSGIGVIDFESWRPIFRQNFGVLQPYIELSLKLVQKQHKFWKNKKRIEAEAKRLFEEAGRRFVAETLRTAQLMRPNARWGYYGFPYCFNINGGANTKEDCPANNKEENDQIKWLWNMTDVVLPSIYLNTKLNPSQRIQYMRGKLREAYRVAQSADTNEKPPMYAYLRYVYTDTLKLLTDEDMKQAIKVAKEQNSDGIIFWGSSFDLMTKQQCLDFRKYIDNNLGPIISNNAKKPKVVKPKMRNVI